MKPLFVTFFVLLHMVAAAQFSDNFELGMLSDWQQWPANRWALVHENALAGDSSLKHVFNNTATATDIVYRSLDSLQVNEGNAVWRFMLRHGYNPSGSNKWSVVLFADAPAEAWKSGGAYQGYVIGVNQGSGSDDTLSLYAVRNNTFSILRKTCINWEKDVTSTGFASVEITRNNEGEWNFRAAINEDFDSLKTVAEPVVHTAYTDAKYFGLMYSYTASADMQLWWDEVSLDFVKTAPPKEMEFGDVVVTEIMAKSDPSAGLPEVLYIELYNRAGRDLRLEGWKLSYNNAVGNITTTVLPDSSYLILCTSSMVNVMKEYGNATALTNMSNLTKSGKTLVLRNAAGRMIAYTSYTNEWIKDNEKSAGGWSLEKIDVNNLSETASNWAVSVAPVGGTPGAENSVRAENPDTEAPFVATLQPLDNNSLVLKFNELFDPEKAVELSAYYVNKGIGQPVEATWEESNMLQVTLRFEQDFEQGVIYELTVAAPFCDLAGNVPADKTYKFGELLPKETEFGDVVITEIMAKSDPSAGLPEVLYIELYNRAGQELRLEGWKLSYNNAVGNITTTVLPDSSYLILCTSSMVNVMKEYGNATALTNMSNLTKSGKTLVLRNAAGRMIAYTNYTNAWIKDNEKSAGGWSLEKIDVNNLSETAANWAVSVAPVGGTPGAENSVRAVNPDTEAPFVITFQPIDNNRLLLLFNELFVSEKAVELSAYYVNKGIGQPVEATWEESNMLQVTLRFDKDFEQGVIYELTVAAPFCDLAGNVPADKTYEFGNLFTPLTNEVVINEVLFNPFTGGVDFVEVFNRSDKIFDVRQLQLANRDKQGDVASIEKCTEKHYLMPNDYAVFTTDLNILQSFYSVPFPEKVVTLKSLPSYPNTEGCVLLLNEIDAIIDDLLYSEKMHSGFISNPEGISLERVNPAVGAAERSNWQSAAQDAGWATPTVRNSQFNDSEGQHDKTFSLRYITFSPDGDGYRDVLFIDYSLPEADYEVAITVYDVQGRVVKDFGKNMLLGASGSLSWDGTRNNGQRALSGLFIVYIQAYSLHGNVMTYKLPCAIALR